jgi:hypothetical protein
MNGVHGRDRRLIAFAWSGAKGWHQAAWDVSGSDEVGEGMAQVAVAGYPKGRGVSRQMRGSHFGTGGDTPALMKADTWCAERASAPRT